MKLRPTTRGNARTIFDILELNGPMTHKCLLRELKALEVPMTKTQINTCLNNMRQREWVEFNVRKSDKIDIRSKVLKQQRTLQRNILEDQRVVERFIDICKPKVEIKPIKFTPSDTDVKTPETEELKPVEAFTVPFPIQVAGMISATAIVTAVSTALAIRIF